MTSPHNKVPVAIIGSGNIGTDLMIKIMRHGKHLSMGAMVGIDPASEGLARAARLGVACTAEGVEGLLALPNFKDIRIAFDATSAGAHAKHNALLQAHGVKVMYALQGATDPPTFTLFVNRELPHTYLRYLERSIREAFDFGSTPIKLRVRKRSE